MKRHALLALLFLTNAPLAHAGDLVDAAEKAESLVEAEKFPEAIKTLEDARNSVWEQSPLTINNAILVAGDPSGYGVYDPRPNNEFKAGEPIVIYTEPKSYAFGRDGDFYTLKIDLDYDIQDASGQSLAKQEKFSTWEFKSRVQNREFMGKLTYNLKGVPAGDYKIITTARDQNADSSVEFSNTIKIVE